MYSKTLLAAFVAAPVAVSAVGNAIVYNNCASNVYMWSVSNENTGSMQTIAPGGKYSEPYYHPASGGVSIKLAKSPFGAFDSSAITQFEYTIDSMIWYDISNINGYPFLDGGLKLVPGEASCPTKVCPSGVKLCGDAYNTPDENDATGACSADSDTSFYLCGDENNAPAAKAPVAEAVVQPAAKPAPKPAVEPVVEEPKPAPAPSSTAAPAPAPVVTSAPAVVPSPAAAVDAGVFTTFVTQIVTVAARDAAPEPTALPLKRDEGHANMHKRAAHRHHFHRHGDVN